jgi:chromosome segregation ATPase
MEGEELYSAKEAERILQRADKPLTESRIRQLLHAGELEGERDERGRWHVYRREVHRLLEERRDPAREAAEEARESPKSAGAWVDRVALEQELRRLEGRLELTERAESTIREERDRLVKELEEVRAERRRLQEELENSRRERSWWRKLFRG